MSNESNTYSHADQIGRVKSVSRKNRSKCHNITDPNHVCSPDHVRVPAHCRLKRNKKKRKEALAMKSGTESTDTGTTKVSVQDITNFYS